MFNLLTSQSHDLKWEKIVLTKDSSEIVGLQKIQDISVEVVKLNIKISKLKKEANEQIKKKASKIGASIVYIKEDTITIAPVSLYVIKGTAYRKY